MDRGPTDEEAGWPDSERPWTEYDLNGDKQAKPDFKACQFHTCLIAGPTCCVFELQWCECCGDDADRTCDVLFRCQTNRMLMCICCGPQCNEPLLPGCCYKGTFADQKVTMRECCECDCCDSICMYRYAGCQVLCCHCTCVKCYPCCVGLCCLGGEEQCAHAAQTHDT